MVETKNKILQSAIDVWGKDLKASLEDVANHLGISTRTLHRHYAGRNELVRAVYDFLLEEYLSRVREAVEFKFEALDRLKALFVNDIKSADRYIIFSHLHETYFSDTPLESDSTKELYTTYRKVLGDLIETGEISKSITLQWLEMFYSTVIETAIKGIKAGLTKEDCMKMAWSSFWNGIKKNEIPQAQ